MGLGEHGKWLIGFCYMHPPCVAFTASSDEIDHSLYLLLVSGEAFHDLEVPTRDLLGARAIYLKSYDCHLDVEFLIGKFGYAAEMSFLRTFFPNNALESRQRARDTQGECGIVQLVLSRCLQSTDSQRLARKDLVDHHGSPMS